MGKSEGIGRALKRYQVSSGFERRDGGEVGGAGVHDAAAEDADPAALALVEVGGQLGHDGPGLLLHCRNCYSCRC